MRKYKSSNYFIATKPMVMTDNSKHRSTKSMHILIVILEIQKKEMKIELKDETLNRITLHEVIAQMQSTTGKQNIKTIYRKISTDFLIVITKFTLIHST